MQSTLKTMTCAAALTASFAVAAHALGWDDFGLFRDNQLRQLVRTLSGISMDIGMSLLVVNMMLTALTSPARARQARPVPAPASIGGRPIPVPGAAE